MWGRSLGKGGRRKGDRKEDKVKSIVGDEEEKGKDTKHHIILAKWGRGRG